MHRIQSNGRSSKIGARNEQAKHPSEPSQVRRLNKQDPFNPVKTQLQTEKTTKAQDAMTPDPRRVLKSSSPVTKLIGHTSQKPKVPAHP